MRYGSIGPWARGHSLWVKVHLVTGNNTSAKRQSLFDKYENTCQSCRTRGIPLEIAHIVPLRQGGTSNDNNIALLCRNCHYLLDTFQPRESVFSAFIRNFLDASPDYSNVAVEQRLGKRDRADITATRSSQDKRESLLIELKSWSSVRKSHIESAIAQIHRYRSIASFDAAALVFPGRVSKGDQSTLEAENIEVWDLNHVARTFSTEIARLPFSGFKQLYMLVPDSDAAKVSYALLNRLRGCTPGNDDWIEFQRVVKDVFEHLFTPPLGTPLWESTDRSKANRRDIIFPNHAYQGFWKFLRESYRADYIVLNTKNYKNKVKKAQILQMANYLKPHGTGMFGVIVSRQGGDAACQATIREQWAAYRKLIILLTDRDMSEMLMASASNGRPEDIVGQVVQDFRLSM